MLSIASRRSIVRARRALSTYRMMLNSQNKQAQPKEAAKPTESQQQSQEQAKPKSEKPDDRYQERYYEDPNWNPHKYFYRELAGPYFKIGFLSIGVFYGMRFLYDCLESSEEKYEETHGKQEATPQQEEEQQKQPVGEATTESSSTSS